MRRLLYIFFIILFFSSYASASVEGVASATVEGVALASVEGVTSEGGGGDSTPPEFYSASISISGVALTITYDEDVYQGVSYNDSQLDIDCTTAGNGIGLTYVSGDGSTSHVYTIDETIYSGDTCNLDFDGTANSLEDGSGNDLAALTSESITNNSTQEASGYDVSDIVFWWKAQTQTLDIGVTDYSVNDYTASKVGSPDINQDITVVSGNNVDVPGATSYYTFNASGLTSPNFIVAFAIKVTTFPASTASAIMTHVPGSTSGLGIGLTSSGFSTSWYTNGIGNEAYCAVSGLSTNTLYYVIVRCETTGSNLYLYVYNSSKSLVTSNSDTDGSMTATTPPNFRVGNTSANSVDYGIDNIRVAIPNTLTFSQNVDVLLGTIDSDNYYAWVP